VIGIDVKRRYREFLGVWSVFSFGFGGNHFRFTSFDDCQLKPFFDLLTVGIGYLSSTKHVVVISGPIPHYLEDCQFTAQIHTKFTLQAI
jgi:hypothetical protein